MDTGGFHGGLDGGDPGHRDPAHRRLGAPTRGFPRDSVRGAPQGGSAARALTAAGSTPAQPTSRGRGARSAAPLERPARGRGGAAAAAHWRRSTAAAAAVGYWRPRLGAGGARASAPLPSSTPVRGLGQSPASRRGRRRIRGASSLPGRCPSCRGDPWSGQDCARTVARGIVGSEGPRTLRD